jgi:hypothetical protein
VTVKRREVFSEVGEIEDPVNVAKQVILRDYLEAGDPAGLSHRD